MALNFPAAPTLLQEYIDSNSQVWICCRALSDGDVVDAWMKQANVNIIYEVVDDETPQLGADLDCNGSAINNSSYDQGLGISLIDGQTYAFDFSSSDVRKITAPASGTITIDFIGFISERVCFAKIDAVGWGNCTVIFTQPIITSGGATIAFTAGMDRLSITKDANDIYFLSAPQADLQES